MTRENAVTKGLRYLVEHRLSVEQVTPTSITASCRGSGALYQLGYARGGWFCSCPALGRCSHLVALQAVTVAPPVRRAQEAAR